MAKGWKMSEEQKLTISSAQKGKVRSEEFKQRVSAALKGRPKTKEHIEAARAATIGKKRTDQFRKECAERQIGKAGLYKRSEAFKQKCAENATKSWRGGQTGEDFAALLCPAGFVREHRVFFGEDKLREFFQLDFAHLEAKTNIELDGPGHRASEEEDKLRDKILKFMGWKVIRIKHE